ncbi:hypothetical protein [Pedobacter sp. SYSU D00535]|uniref:hypothetical protein n=1 Tax=Pedobacter sp. SYSU D00535 TaxID=2810308 RepID=UPI001A972A22|nr:hypothetical protein [Pedobacter sp. SYSU D00535]
MDKEQLNRIEKKLDQLTAEVATIKSSTSFLQSLYTRVQETKVTRSKTREERVEEIKFKLLNRGKGRAS